MNLRTLAVVGLVLSVPAEAGAGDQKCDWCTKGAHGAHAATDETPATTGVFSPAPTYDAGSEGLVAGVIYSVMHHPGMDVRLTIGVGEKSFDVLVAPMDCLDGKQVVFRQSERVQIVGAPAYDGSVETIVAREIYTADQMIVLRDSQGRPLWK